MNNRGPFVRELDDRRVRRTRQALSHAFVELTLEKGYDAITVQNLLDRADVGRATFYAHYRGKDDLLTRSFVRMLGMLDRAIDRDPPGIRRVAPVRELFEHVGNVREFQRALARAGLLESLFQAGVDQAAATIERRLATRGVDDRAPVEVRARALAGAMFALLRWWIDREPRPSADAMDRMFHAL